MKQFAEYDLQSMTTREQNVVRALLENPDNFALKENLYEIGGDKQNWSSLFKECCQHFCIGDTEKHLKNYIIDSYTCSVLYGMAPEEYFQFKFYEKNDLGRKEYFCDKERFKLLRPFYDFEKYELVRDKWRQYKSLKEYYRRDCILLSTDDECSSFEEFCQFIEDKDCFIFKPTRASCGQGVKLLKVKWNNLHEQYTELCSFGGIADEQIVQRDCISEFHADSVNTVRLIALRGLDGSNYYTQCLFRMGRGAAIVDNSSEAVRAMIDEKTGVVYTYGTDSYGNKFIHHPDTGKQIVGFNVPEWNDLLKIADDVMAILEDYARFIGFDFALSEEGWKIIEVNPFPQMVTQQIVLDHGCRKMIYEIVSKCQSGKD